MQINRCFDGNACDVDAGQGVAVAQGLEAIRADPGSFKRFAMTDTESRSLTPRTQMPFIGDIDQLFNHLTRSWLSNAPDFNAGGDRALQAFEHKPKIEVKENDKSYTVTMELPGLDEMDVKVQVGNDVLSIASPFSSCRPIQF
jgi:hypothetical protein